MSVFIILFSIFAWVECQNKEIVLDCPFEVIPKDYRYPDINVKIEPKDNCLRSSEFKEYLKNHPEKMNERVDIVIKNATAQQLEEIKECCFELECMVKCGYNRRKLLNIAYILRLNLKNYISQDSYYFLNYNQTEVDLISDGKASEDIINKWNVKLLYLSHIRISQRKSQKNQ